MQYILNILIFDADFL